MHESTEECSEGELWAVIPGFSKYMASTLGRIKLQDGRISEGTISLSGYRYITLTDDSGKSRSRSVHRLVAFAWLPNPENKRFVDHLDRCPSNCKLSNLRWVTIEENMQNKAENIQRNGRLVNQYSFDSIFMKEWTSITSITRELGFSDTKIRDACYKNTLLGDCYWEFVDTIPIEGEIWEDLFINNVTIGVSTEGRIRTPSGMITYGHKRRSGYMCININRKTFLVHRLVLMAHDPIENPELYQVNHKNFVTDWRGNKLSNLEWCTRSENINHSVLNKGRRKTTKPVCQYDLKGKLLRRFETMREAYKYLGDKSAAGLIAVCDKRCRTYRNFIWRYASENLSEVTLTFGYNYVPINMFDLNGKFIKRFNGVIDASKELGDSSYSGNIVKVCMGRQISAYNYIWRYADKDDKAHVDNVEGKNPVKITLPIRQYDLDGNFIEEYETMGEAYNLFNDKNGTGLYPACKSPLNKLKSYMNFYWRFAYENLDSVEPSFDGKCIAVNMLDLDGKFVKRFGSLSAAARQIVGKENAATNINYVCKGAQKTAYGYKWEYATDENNLSDEVNLEDEIKLDEEVNSTGLKLEDLDEINEEDLDNLFEEEEDLDDFFEEDEENLEEEQKHPPVTIKVPSGTKGEKRSTKEDKPEEKKSIPKESQRNRRPVAMFSKDGEFIKTFDSIIEAACEIHSAPTNVVKACKGKRQTCMGYKFKYLEEVEEGLLRSSEARVPIKITIIKAKKRLETKPEEVEK